MKSIRALIVMLLLTAVQAAAADVTVQDSHGKPANLDSIIAAISSDRAVFVGESHDRYDEHLSELEVIRRLYEKDPQRWAIGVEFIQRPFQKYLDDYVAGTISEKEFLKQTEYFDRWGFDFRLYRPIFQFARDHHIPMVALNAERELTDKVSKVGLEGLTPEERAKLPETYDKSNKHYRKILEKIYKQHMKSTGPFEHFWEAQLTWDETMAQRATDYLKAHPDKSIIVLAGEGHIESGYGIPSRLRRRLPDAKTAILLAEDKAEKGHADYFLISKEQDLPPAPKMGIVMEEKDGVQVKDVTSGGAAEAAGIKPRDHIVAVDGQEVHSLADVRLALFDKKVGDTVAVQVQREGGSQSVFEVKLK